MISTQVSCVWQSNSSTIRRKSLVLSGRTGRSSSVDVFGTWVIIGRSSASATAASPLSPFASSLSKMLSIWALLDREGWTVNKKAVRRLYRELGLKVAQPRANPKPRRAHGQDKNACHLRPARGKDDVWTWDFIFDRTSDGRSLKWLSIIDEYTRECLALEARRGITAENTRIILAEDVAGRGGPPCRMRSDNRPAFVAEVVRSWLEETESGSLPVAPGSPWQNGYAESFQSKVRDKFLNRDELESEPQARALGALRKGCIIPNASTVPWDIRHRPNSRPLV